MVQDHGTIWLGWVAGVAVATLGASPIAHADAGFRFSGPPQCPTESSVQQNAAAMVGRPVDALDALDVDARVTVLPDGRLQLAIRTPDGERELIEDTCGPLAEAAMLIVALLLDPALEQAAGPEGPSAAVTQALASPRPMPSADSVPSAPRGAPGMTESAQPQAAAPSASIAQLADPRAPVPSELAVGAPAPAASRLRVGLGAGFVLDLATLPSVAPGAMAEVVLHVDSADIRVRALWLAEQGAGIGALSAPMGSAVRTLYAGGSLGACGRPFAEFGLGFCGAIHAGAIVARGDGISDPSQAEGVLFALAGGLTLPWQPIPELDLELGAELVVPLATPTFVVAPFGDVFQPAPVSGRFTLAVHVDVS